MTGAEVRLIRKASGLTATQFADLIGVHLTSLYRWEARGRRQLPPLDTGARRTFLAIEVATAPFLGRTKRLAAWWSAVRLAFLTHGSIAAVGKIFVDATRAAKG